MTQSGRCLRHSLHNFHIPHLMSLPFPVWNSFPECQCYFLLAFFFLELCGFSTAMLNIVSCYCSKAFLVKPLHYFIMNSLFLELFADCFSNIILKLYNWQKTRLILLTVPPDRSSVYIARHCTLEHYYCRLEECLYLSVVFPYTVSPRYNGNCCESNCQFPEKLRHSEIFKIKKNPNTKTAFIACTSYVSRGAPPWIPFHSTITDNLSLLVVRYNEILLYISKADPFSRYHGASLRRLLIVKMLQM